ncbi:uncharacterized protein LOC143693955 [Agelaius phoeniceus]|uniref:uncharacterized protein LOC143693955 n=1 Tax=Agelaius phoeniceus TaxID=39638 RepID=UPI004055354D
MAYHVHYDATLNSLSIGRVIDTISRISAFHCLSLPSHLQGFVQWEQRSQLPKASVSRWKTWSKLFSTQQEDQNLKYIRRKHYLVLLEYLK